MITYAEIYHFKSVAEAKIPFGSQNIIVGPNGVGKSNIVDALYFVRDCAIEDLDTAIVKRHGIESIRQWSKTRPYNITIDLYFRSPLGTGRYAFSLASGRGSFSVLWEEGVWTGQNPLQTENPDEPLITSTFSRNAEGQVNISVPIEGFSVESPRSVGIGDLFLTSIQSRFFSTSTFMFRHLSEEISSFSSYSIYPNTLRQPQIVSNEEILMSDGSNLAAILKRLNSGYKKNKDEMIAGLQVVIPMISDIIVRSAGGYYVPVMRVREANGENHDFNMSQVSDGTLRILGLLAAFYQPKVPSKIAVEEPEQMLHPGILPVIADAAKSYLFSADDDARQTFLTTHSPHFIDLFPAESIIWTSFQDGVTSCGPIAKRQLELIKARLFSAGEILVSEGFLP